MMAALPSDWWRACRAWIVSHGPWRRRSLGQRGEDEAARFLRRLGYRIVARGERLRLGEIDLIAVHQRTMIFVEVKTLTALDHGRPEERVTRDKQRRLTRLALAWLKRRRLLEYPTRFDVVAVHWPDPARSPTIRHFIAAFEATGCDGMYS